MVPMFRTAALAFRLRLESGPHVLKIIVTIELEIAQAKKTVAALGAFLGRVRSI